MIFRKTRVFHPIIWSPPVDFCLPYLVYLVLEIKLRLHQTCQIHFVVFHWFPPPAHKSRVQLNLISKFFQCLLTLFLKLFTLFAFMNIMSCHDHVAALSLYIIIRDVTLATGTVYSTEYPRGKTSHFYYSIKKDRKNTTRIKPLFCTI